MKTPIRLALTVLAFLGVSVGATRAQDFPDGGYLGNNTAEGALALRQTLRFYPQPPPPGLNNTALGFHALMSNISGSRNTAAGADALVSNTTGGDNTATGALALQNNTTGQFNTATGASALDGNTTGFGNTANGYSALLKNTIGHDNTANGSNALFANTTGNYNAASGVFALFSNTSGERNTAIGFRALVNNTSGGFNVALGAGAGSGVITADDVICIGRGVAGANVGGTCFIGNIRNVTTQNANALPVVIDGAGQLGTVSSSQRFKHDIKPMGKASEGILALEPVTFRYKSDSANIPQFGLIAEEVEKVNPDLVVRDKNGEIYTVRYEAVNAMLLNEFLKEHRKVENLRNDFQATVAQHQKEIAALTATVKEQASQIQKVSAQLEVMKPAPQTVLNNQ
jgi:hypothetical protein